MVKNINYPENLTQGNYTVLCIGLDDNDEQEVGGSGKTYNLPEAIRNKTLSEAKATLAGGKTKDDIAKSELFAGWNQFHFAPDSLNIVDVEMKRRVAGVLCYLTDVPYQLTQDNKTYRITSVELWLYTKQNTGIKLCREEITGGEYPEDFGDTSGGDLEGSELIGQQSMINSGFGVNADKTLYTRDKQTIKTTDGREVTIKENSILMGAYLIPIDYDATKSTIITDANLKKDVTLQVALRGVEVASIDEDITDEKIKGAQIVRSFPAFNDDIDLDIDNSSGTPVATPSYTYPIRPNIIYHIGNKPSDEEEGTPESLAGTKVNIVAEEWTDQEINVEFPSVPVVAYIELVREYLDANGNKKVEIYDANSDYTFDCIGIDDEDPEGYYKTGERLYARVHPSVLTKDWILTITEGSESTTSSKTLETLFVSKGNGNYENSYEGIGQEVDDVQLLLTSYAKDDNQKERYATLTLTMTDDRGNQLEPVSMTIKQYNAIIVALTDDNDNLYNEGDTKKRGFCHYDWLNGSPSQWGYYRKNDASMNVNWIYGNITMNLYYGQSKYEDAKSEALENDNTKRKEEFGKSVMYKAAKKFLGVKEGKKQSFSKIWYLPARYELRDFITQYGNSLEKGKDNGYWSSSAYGLYKAYYNYVENDGSPFDEGNRWDSDDDSKIEDRNESFKMRQACVVE